MKLNKMKTKKLKSYITIKQRITATFMVVVLLLQICIPTVALAATAWGSQAEFNRQLQMQLNSGLFSAVELAEADEAYKAAFYVYQDAQKTDNLLDFYRSYNCVTGSPVIKQIGDTFVQTRLIRSQIKALMGRFLIQESIAPLTVYEAEAERINGLYKSGIAYGQKTCDDKLPMGSPLAENTSVAVDMIWPEVRTVTINNVAVSVLVPVVYLSQTTLDRRVDGHQINFLGDTTFAGITLNSGVLLNGYNNTITGINGIINNGGKIASGGDLTLFSSGTIANLGGVFNTTKNLEIITNDFLNKSLVVSYKDKNGEGTKVGSIASISGGNIEIDANNDVTFEGATATSGGKISLNAGGDINVLPVTTQGGGQSQEGHWSVNKSTTDLLMSRLAAEDTLSLIAGGLINITASELISTQGGIELLAGQGIHILDELEQTSIQKEDRKGKTTGTSSEFRTEAVRAILKAGKGVLLDSEHGDVVLRATQLTSASGAEVYAKNGKVHLLMTKELEEFHLQTVRKSTWTIKTRTEDIIHENNIQNAIVGGLQVKAMYGINVEYTGKEGASLKEQLEEYAKMPEMAWMAKLYNKCWVEKEDGGITVGSVSETDPNNSTNCDGPKVSWKQIEEVHEEIRKSKTNLSPAAMAIIAIAVCIAMGPAGAGLIGAGGVGGATVTATSIAGVTTVTTTISLTGAIAQAAMLTLATRGAQSLAAGNNLRETISTFDSDENLRSLAISMATAGAMNYANVGNVKLFDVPAGGEYSFASLGNQAYSAVAGATINSVVSVSIGGGNSQAYRDAFKQSLVLQAVNAIGQSMANKISSANTLGGVTKYIAHAAMGCLTAGLTNKLSDQDFKDACRSGAGGAVVSQITVDLLDAKAREAGLQILNAPASITPTNIGSTLGYLGENGVDLSKFIAGIIAFAAGGDVNVAANSAGMTAQSYRDSLQQVALIGQIMHGMGAIGCNSGSATTCGANLAELEMRVGLKSLGKYSDAEIETEVIAQRNLGVFASVGEFNKHFLSDKVLNEMTGKPASGSWSEHEYTLDKQRLSALSTGIIEYTGKANIRIEQAGDIARDAVKVVLNKPIMTPIVSAVTYTAKKGAEIAQQVIDEIPGAAGALEKKEMFEKGIGIGAIGFLTDNSFDDVSDATSDPRYHDELERHSASAISWIVVTVVGVAATVATTYAAVKYIKPGEDNFDSPFQEATGEEDFYHRAESAVPAVLTPDLDSHVISPEIDPRTNKLKIKEGGFVGGHNKDEFEKALENPRSLDLIDPVHAGIDPSGKIINTIAIKDNQGRTVGYEYEYELPRVHANGPNAGEVITENGVVLQFPAKRPKTVYDPQVISDTEYLQMISRVGKDAYARYAPHFARNQEKIVHDAQTGLNFHVRVRWSNNTTPVIENVYLVK